MTNHFDHLYIILPAFNEAKYIVSVLKAVKKYTSHIIVVDDGSTDATARLARQFTPYCLKHPINLGKGAALKTGCLYAFRELHAQAVILMDADAQHDPQALSQFAQALQTYDLVFGVRDLAKNMPLVRVLANRLASLSIKWFFGAYLPDIPCGFKGLTRKAFRVLCWEAAGYSVEIEIAIKTLKYHVSFGFVPITTVYQDYNRGMTTLDAFNTLGTVLSWKFRP